MTIATATTWDRMLAGQDRHSLADVLADAAATERARLARDRYYARTHGGDWPEDH